jgi:hypothetical protein
LSATNWNLLRNYQSHDFVTRLYQTHNGRIPGAQTAKEITSCFVQAEEYFRNAASAANSVKPLLLYYGVLSFAKGVVLFLNPIKREATMKASHGVETLNWKETFVNAEGGRKGCAGHVEWGEAAPTPSKSQACADLGAAWTQGCGG